MRLTDEQAQEMERQLVLRILGDACQEYAYAFGELERSDGFRRYVMHRAESSGFTIEEIAEVTALSASDVRGILHEDGETVVANGGTVVANGGTAIANGDAEHLAGVEVASVVVNGSDRSDFDDLADAIGHLNIQIGDDRDDESDDAVEMIESEKPAEPSRLPWSWNRS